MRLWMGGGLTTFILIDVFFRPIRMMRFGKVDMRRAVYLRFTHCSPHFLRWNVSKLEPLRGDS